KRRWKLQTVFVGLQANAWAHDIHGMLGIHEIGQYIQLWHAVEHTTLTTEPDRLLWKWTSSGSYSAKSCYQATFQGSIHSSSWKFIWKNWAPLRVRIFHWLSDQDRCWTADRLARH
uniref:Reverse transcriptase zinc-binding domain-containing protein n=1 Tax=Aegilops tauschii subsp. strangulata TaxID=200361 RepID=A0A453AAK1_AEGTS